MFMGNVEMFTGKPERVFWGGEFRLDLLFVYNMFMDMYLDNIKFGVNFASLGLP